MTKLGSKHHYFMNQNNLGRSEYEYNSSSSTLCPDFFIFLFLFLLLLFIFSSSRSSSRPPATTLPISCTCLASMNCVTKESTLWSGRSVVTAWAPARMLNPMEMTRTSNSTGEFVMELGAETVTAVFFSSLLKKLCSSKTLLWSVILCVGAFVQCMYHTTTHIAFCGAKQQ